MVVAGTLLKKQVTKNSVVYFFSSWSLGSCLSFAVCVSGFPERGTIHKMMSVCFVSSLKT